VLQRALLLTVNGIAAADAEHRLRLYCFH